VKGNDRDETDVPRNMPPTAVLPVCLSASQPLYVSKLAKRMAILGTIPERTAPRPLYSASGVSRLTMYAPVAMNPLGFVCARYCTVVIKPGSNEAHPWRKPRLGELHADLDGVQRLTNQLT
jgi:hypothetical protein